MAESTNLTTSIKNPSFEAPTLNDGAFTLTPPTSWNIFDSFGFIPQNPTSTSSKLNAYNPTKSNYLGEAPNGQNVGSINLIQNPNVATVGLAQLFDTVIQSNTQYTLSVDIGNPAGSSNGIDLTGFPGYRVLLLAGDEIVAIDNNSLNIEEGKFATSSVTFTAADGESFIGKNLGVRLINALTGEGKQVDFDDVRLRASTVIASAVKDNQTLYGSSGNTTLNGSLGNDILFGNGLSTNLFSRDGNDQVFGASKS